MGRPELNGKIDTLTSGSTNNSVLLMNRFDSNANIGSSPGSVSSFAKSKMLSDQKNKANSKSFKVNNGPSNQSFLKAAIFRNMQKNSEAPTEEVKDHRRGSIDSHLPIFPAERERRYSAFLSPKSPQDPEDKQRTLSVSPGYEEPDNDDSEEGDNADQTNEEGSDDTSTMKTVKLLQPPNRRFQPFSQKR